MSYGKLQADEKNNITRLGLTLSGGGARGLAHIGVLHIIDSLDIRPDYITGTSMGAIVGGMYAAGYSASEIEEIALELDWESMFSRRSELGYIHPARRDNYKTHIVELPIEDRKIRTPTGAIEGQQLWNTLSEIFFHTYNITDFRKLKIPFACIATNVETGEAVVISEGSLVTAIRASMAMPSIFTTVEREGLKLIDGGVANNFPVRLAKDMGADYVIGVNVSQGLRPADELISPVDIIYQMGFYSDARSFIQNREATDLYINIELAGYSAASFAHSQEIIEQGKNEARKFIEHFLEISAMQDKTDSTIRQRDQAELVVDTVIFKGLKEVRLSFAKNSFDIFSEDTISARSITRAVNRLYASNYFNRVNYHLTPGKTDDSVILTLEVDEKPFANLAGGINFSSFTGVGITGKIGTNNFFHYNAEASFAVMIGEKPAFRADLIYFLDERRQSWLHYQSSGRRFNFPLYERFEQISEYRQNFLRNTLSINTIWGRNSYVSFYNSHYYQSLSPNMRTPTTLEGSNSSFEAGVNFLHHTLNRNSFPTSGQRININGALIYNQRPSISNIRLNGEEATLEDLGIDIGNFFQLYLTSEKYIPITSTVTQIVQMQLGYNLNYNQGFINAFNIGGTNRFLDKQFTFMGINEYQVISESALIAAIGYQYSLGRSFYLTGLLNSGLYDFRFDKPELVSKDNFLFGGGLSLGFDSLIGPMELTFSYSHQTRNVIGYINLGWLFQN